MITYEWSDWRNRNIWWIQSVYVKPEARRKGVYAAMYAHIKNLVQADPSIGGIRLYVDKTNTPAQHTYSKLGMNGDHYQVFEWMKKH
jgi:ribosomal protein S18 acetylase RimI-like enzyme